VSGPARPDAPLLGRYAVVTGASSGIGAAIAIRLCAAGATVVGVGRDKARLSAVADQATAAAVAAGVTATDVTDADVTDGGVTDGGVTDGGRPGGPFVPAQVDLTDDTALAAFLTDLADLTGRHPRLDILVHSAGSYVNGAHETASLADLDAQYAANVRAPYALTQGLIPALRAGGGDVIVINSSQGVNAASRTGQFAATQHAMRAVTDSLRQELNDDGVRVCGIHLGRTATPRQEAIFATEGRPYRPELLVQPEDVAAVVLSVLTLGANAEVTELHLRPARKSY
jgi:NADP-dependent 3-hydroxy acid dehydrogenase YdfG